MSDVWQSAGVFGGRMRGPRPDIVRGEGVRLWDADGVEYIDSTSGAISVISVGHGRKEVIEAMSEQAGRFAYVQGGRFSHDVADELARALARFTPGDLNRVFFVSGGSEANETAIKLAHQYHQLRGNPAKRVVLSRQRSYHGNTLGALSVSGYAARRAPYEDILLGEPSVVDSNCYRCPLGLTYPSCELACATDLERAISEVGAEHVSAFIAEPIVAAAGGAATPPPEYFQRIRAICDANDILFIADEVVTGIGRTGRNFGIDHWDVVPDIIVTAKGLAGGYAPLGAVIVTDRVEQVFIDSGTPFVHGYTYQSHPVACAAGLAVLKIIEREELVENAAVMGDYLFGQLRELKAKHPMIGDIRGEGLLAGIELVADPVTRQPIDPALGLSQKIVAAAFAEGIMVYPCNSGDGVHSDQFLLSPPLTVTHDDIDQIIDRLDRALDAVDQGW